MRNGVRRRPESGEQRQGVGALDGGAGAGVEPRVRLQTGCEQLAGGGGGERPVRAEGDVTPAGPALVLLDADELKRFGDLRLRLRVNGGIRQDAIVDGDMIYPPLQVLRALARFHA